MLGREDLDECPKCHNTGIHLQFEYGPESVTSSAKFCDCPIAKSYLARLRTLPVLKSRLALIQRDVLERAIQLKP